MPKDQGPSLFDRAADLAAVANPDLPRSQAIAEIKGAPRVAAPPSDGIFGGFDPSNPLAPSTCVHNNSEPACKDCDREILALTRKHQKGAK